jgi:hypothetical protein
MRPIVWTALIGAALGALAVGIFAWRIHGETTALEVRLATLEVRRGPLREIEDRVDRYHAVRGAVEARRRLVQGVRDRQAPTAALLASLAAQPDPRVDRISLTPDGGTIAGTAASPVAASEIGEQLQSRGLVQTFEFDRFTNGKYSLSFSFSNTKASEPRP